MTSIFSNNNKNLKSSVQNGTGILVTEKDKHYADNRRRNVILSRGISYVLSVGGSCSNLATMEVTCPMKNGSVSRMGIKGWLSPTCGPFYYCHHRKKNFSAI